MDDIQTQSDSTFALSDRVAEELRALLARRRMSGRDLAKRLDVSPSWVSYRLTGTTEIGLNDLERIAQVLGVEVTALLPPAGKVERIAYPSPPVRMTGPRTPVDLLIRHPADPPKSSSAATRTAPRRPIIQPYRHEGVPA